MSSGSVFDYLRWRGDLDFQSQPANEVDYLICAKLIYRDFPSLSLSLQELASSAAPSEDPRSAYDLLMECGESKRFAKVRVSDFVRIFDPERKTQFAAAAFHLNDGQIFVAFRGTDDSIVGWREDFNLCYMEETPAQAEAVSYLERIHQLYGQPLVVGGHSKGGNLAAYAAAFCSESCQNSTLAVYSYDGPGFNQSISTHPNYLQTLPKIHLLIPESSVIGLIFSSDQPKEVLQCSGSKGFRQHDPYTWLVERDHFLRASALSPGSVIIDEALKLWMDSLDLEQRENFVSALFDVLEASGAQTIKEMNANRLSSYNAIFKATTRLRPDLKNGFFHAMLKLAAAGGSALWDETKRHFEE